MKKLAIGIMSGTSLDGIDVAVAEISGHGTETNLKLIAFDTVAYSAELLQKIRKSLDIKLSNAELLCSLNFELAYAMSDAVIEVCKKNHIQLNDINFIASHGQTIFHIPQDNGDLVRSTLQLGEGSVIANICNTTVVSNFRCADIAVGGQGAPLVPFADYILFKDSKKNRVLQNIGGISNVTVVSKDSTFDSVYAFDTGPGNMMIDCAMQTLFNKNYDESGQTARSGKVINKLIEELFKDSYFDIEPPKSTGRERYGNEYTLDIIRRYSHEKKEDIITTLTHFTALSVRDSFEKFVFSKHQIDEIIISGGGAYNNYLIELYKNLFPNQQIMTLEDLNLSSSAKEALAFIVLGNETLNKMPSNLIKATGASKQTILGQINYII